MANITWTFDAPTGTYKSHAMSMRLYESALEKSVFMDYAKPVEGFGRKKGESVTLTRVAEITEPTDVTLEEAVRIPEDEYALSTKAITVEEIGRSVPYTSLMEDLSEFNIANSIQKRLRSQMQLSLDTKAATAFKLAKVKYIPTSPGAGTFDTDGTASTTATDNISVYHLEEIRDYMFDTLRVPYFDGDNYVGVFRTLALRGIKRDPQWEEWHKYTDPSAKYNSEVGKIEEIRLVETNHNKALGKVGTNSVLGEGVVFGEDAIAMAEVLTPELRAAMPQDFGRSKAVAWYGILKLDIIWDTANAGEARIVHVTSA